MPVDHLFREQKRLFDKLKEILTKLFNFLQLFSYD